MIAKLASGGSQKSSTSSAYAAGSMSASQSKRKRSKLLDLLLNTNWSKQSQQASNLMKINKVLLCCDPNFLDEKSGESPLSLVISSQQINSPFSTSLNLTPTLGCSQSASLFNLQGQHSSSSHNQITLRQTSAADLSQSKVPLVEKITLLLIKNGARVDFRNNDSRTPLHVAAMKSNFWSLKTLLELGASPDYRDINGLTPLYYSILHRAELRVTHLLLNHSGNRDSSNLNMLNGSINTSLRNSSSNVDGHNNYDSHPENKGIGINDQQGWQEVHHACKLGLDAHLDKLLYYGCNINAKITGSGNTPLHVAAINDQLNCAKVLLLRGADKTITNNSHQTAHQVAVIANNMDLAEFITEHDDSRVVPFAERPAPLVMSPNVTSGVGNIGTCFTSNRHSFALPKSYTGINQHHSRLSVSSVQHLVNSQSTNNLPNQRRQTTYDISSQNQAQQQQYQFSTLTRASGHIQPRLRQVNPLVLDMSESHQRGNEMAISSAPTSDTGAGDSSTPIASKTSLLSINANQPPHLSNTSPSLSQRSCATTNTTATSSSGVCCDGDAQNGSAEELIHSQSRHSNITIISIGSTGYKDGQNGIETSNNAINDRNSNNSHTKSQILGEGSTRILSGLNSFLPQMSSVAAAECQKGEVYAAVSNGCPFEASGRSSYNSTAEGDHEFNATAAAEDRENDDEEDLRSSASSGELQSLMSDERPLYVGSIVEVTSEYQSGDPNHLQLRRGNLIEVLDYPPEMIQAGQLPRLANKLLLYGRRPSDGMQGLFPSFCVRRTRQRQSGLRQQIIMTDRTHASASQSKALASTASDIEQKQQQHQQLLDHNQTHHNTATNLAESRSLMTLSNDVSQLSLGPSPQIPKKESANIIGFHGLEVNLTKINEGFGFVLRGARINPATLATNQQVGLPGKILIDERLMLANNLASLQYLDNIEPGSVAEQAGLKRGDFLVAVNRQDVRLCSHEQVVHLIRQSGDSVHLTISKPVSNSHPNYATSFGSKTLGRKKPEPPKRDPTTTLTRNKTRLQSKRTDETRFDDQNIADHKFDCEPQPCVLNAHIDGKISPSNSLNSTGISSNMMESNSIQSLSSGVPETQSITSISTSNSTASYNYSNNPSNQAQTPTHSSSSTATLTTVATTKPKAPAKPSHLREAFAACAPSNVESKSDQQAYQSAVIQTNRRAQQASPASVTPQKASILDSDIDSKRLQSKDSNYLSDKIQQSEMDNAPPPPPPLPDFSNPTSGNRLTQRRTSAPINQSHPHEINRFLKRRESLATNIAPPSKAAANMSSVAAACAAAANSRLMRQQEQQLKEQKSQDADISIDAEGDSVSVERKVDNVIDQITKFPPPPPLPVFSSPHKASSQIDQVNGHTDLEDRRDLETKQKVLSATLGRKFPAQIIQQQKPSNVSQSQTLRTKTKRPSILDYADELPPPPEVPRQSSPRTDNTQLQQNKAVNQQIAVNECQHNHHLHLHHQHQSQLHHKNSANGFEDLVQEMNEYEINRRASKKALAIQQQLTRQQQLAIQQQHQMILLQQMQQPPDSQHRPSHQIYRDELSFTGTTSAQHGEHQPHHHHHHNHHNHHYHHSRQHEIHQGRQNSSAQHQTSSATRIDYPHQRQLHQQSLQVSDELVVQQSQRRNQHINHHHQHHKHIDHEDLTTATIAQQQHKLLMDNRHGHHRHHQHQQQQNRHQHQHQHHSAATAPMLVSRNHYVLDSNNLNQHYPQQHDQRLCQQLHQQHHQQHLNGNLMPVVYSNNFYATID